MTEAQKLEEIKKLLAFIYFEWKKEVTPKLISFWRLNLAGIDRKDAWKAAKILVERKSFGEPKFQDFAECVKEIQAKRPRKYNPWGQPAPTKEIVRTLIDGRKLLQ